MLAEQLTRIVFWRGLQAKEQIMALHGHTKKQRKKIKAAGRGRSKTKARGKHK